MPFQILINLIIALIWMFLNSDWTATGFLVGYILGILILFFMRRFLPQRFYIAQFFAIVYLISIFLKELFLSAISVVGHVIRPKLAIKPGIFALETDLKSDWEITTLSCLITLTPGTLVIDVSNDNKILYIHCLNLDDVEQEKQQIKNTFEKAIMEVSQ